MSKEAYAALVGGGVLTCILLTGAVALFCKERTLWSFLQLFGAGCLVVVVLTHVFESLHLLPWMRWGAPHSAGHYLDLGSAAFGVTMFPVGYMLGALKKP